MEPEGLSWLFDRVCADAGVRPVFEAPPQVEVTCRYDDTHTWLFLLNHSDRSMKVELPSKGFDLLTSATMHTLELEPKGVSIIQLQILP